MYMSGKQLWNILLLNNRTNGQKIPH